MTQIQFLFYLYFDVRSRHRKIFKILYLMNLVFFDQIDCLDPPPRWDRATSDQATKTPSAGATTEPPIFPLIEGFPL